MGTTRTETPYVAKLDANQYPTLLGVSGTVGTADVNGTAEVIRIGADPATGALYVNNIGAAGGGGGTVVQVAAGTVYAQGADATLFNPVRLTDGTNFYNASGGGGGTVVRIETGTVALVSSVGELVKGTLQSVGTVPGIGVVSNLTNGSVNILTGTIQSSGTTTGVGVVTTVSNLTNGSINLLTGTLTRLSNLGTLESGTVRLDPTTVPQMLQQGTLGTAGGSFFATISAVSGAGTKHYVQGIDIVIQSGTADVRVLAGSAIQGTGVLAAGQFPAGGGISKNWSPHFQTGTNSEIIYHFVGAGTAFITVSYWKGA